MNYHPHDEELTPEHWRAIRILLCIIIPGALALGYFGCGNFGP